MRNLLARRVVERGRCAEPPRWVFAVLLLVACGKTPVDAIVPEASGTDGGDPCSEGVGLVTAGLFRLRSSSNQCLSVGDPTTIVLSPAHETRMLDDCSSGEIWELKPTTTMGVSGYEIASTTVRENLDITMAQTEDGTPAITFAPNDLGNQNFAFRPRRPRVFEMAPANVIGQASCLSSAPPTPAIQRCNAAAIDQEWTLIAAECS